jgi:hypothetical protein
MLGEDNTAVRNRRLTHCLISAFSGNTAGCLTITAAAWGLAVGRFGSGGAAHFAQEVEKQVA